jgi:hypothetical protein
VKIITFIVPFRPKKTSNNWELHSKQLNRTLRSICAQINKEFQVIVVYTELPLFQFEHENLRYIRLPNYEVTLDELGDEEMNRFAVDHARRVMWGVTNCLSTPTKYIMSVDADDLVSNRISFYLSKLSNDIPGFVVKKGYVCLGNSKYLYKESNFNLINGSSHIVKYDLIEIPNWDLKTYSHIDFNLFTAHGWLEDRLRKQMGVILQELPFRAVMYMLNEASHSNEVNNSITLYRKNGIKKYIKFLTRARKLTKKKITEFGYFEL